MVVTANSTQASSPSLPLKTRFAVSMITSIFSVCHRRGDTVNRRLFNLLTMGSKLPPNLNPIDGVKTYDITVDPSRVDLWFRVFVPTNCDQSLIPVIVFFHGGGFVYLSADMKYYEAVGRRFARELPAIIVSVNYRLAPEHRYPAQYDDGIDVLKFLDSTNKVLPENADLSSCFLAGDSAGGNLAHHVAKRACASNLGRLKVIGVVSIQPFFGGEDRTETEKNMVRPVFLSTGMTDWVWRAFLPEEEGCDRDHEAINVSGPRAADISMLDFPATIVVVGGFDVLQDWQRKYYQWLKMSGKEAYLIEYPTMIHAFYLFPELPESGDLVSKVRDFVYKQMG